MDFTLYPAIDLRAGNVVRLRQGDPSAQTIYSDDPARVAVRWSDLGATWLHVVNLDGAFGANAGAAGEGPALNLRRLAEIRSATAARIQFGGGLRTLADVERALDLGADRVVLGTAAVRDPDMVGTALRQFGADRIAIGLDARGKRLAVQGWLEASDLSPIELAVRLRAAGIETAVYTDIGRDGMLTGVNIDATVALATKSGLGIIASGGIRDLDDIRRLLDHSACGVVGAIAGQALYTGALDLKHALDLVRCHAPRSAAAETRSAGVKEE